MQKILTVISILALLSTGGLGAMNSSDAGSAAAQFLKLGAGARAEGMGDAFVAVCDDATAIYWHPAGLNRIQGRSLSVMHAVWFEDISYDWISYAQKAGNTGACGVGVQYLSYGSIPARDDTGLERGSFNPDDLAVSLSYARSIQGFALGINAKYISSRIQNSACALAGDIGVQHSMAHGRLSLGLAIQNIGTPMKFIDAADPLPGNIKLGAACLIHNNWTAALDINAPVDNAVTLGAGTEYRYVIDATMTAAGRVGYNTRARDTGGVNGISAGFGFSYLCYSIDYAFVPYGDLGNTHRISLSITF